MKLGDFFVLTLIVCISIIQISATDRYRKENDDLYYRQFKRFFYNKDPTSTTKRSPSIIDDLVFSSTRSTPIWTQKSTSSSYYQPSGACASNPCEHGGICTSKGQITYECRCVGPWRGLSCNVADACYKSPCLNGGTCLNAYDDYWCKCPNDYYGNNCQTKYSNSDNSKNNCRPNICNTGRCVSLQTTYYCSCPDDRYGEHCEKRFYKRNISKRQSFYHLMYQLKRVMDKHDIHHENDKDERAYYDFKNGIYF